MVVQWDYPEPPENGGVDGFTVKYIHEPSADGNSEKWRQVNVADPKARHLEITRLPSNRAYAFCVLAVKANVCRCPFVDMSDAYFSFRKRYDLFQSVARHETNVVSASVIIACLAPWPVFRPTHYTRASTAGFRRSKPSCPVQDESLGRADLGVRTEKRRRLLPQAVRHKGLPESVSRGENACRAWLRAED